MSRSASWEHTSKMPRSRTRQRIVYCDCRDCVDVSTQPVDYEWERAARQLPPPRSLVLLLEGFNSDPSSDMSSCGLDELALPHFNNVARRGVTCCAAVPQRALNLQDAASLCSATSESKVVAVNTTLSVLSCLAFGALQVAQPHFWSRFWVATISMRRQRHTACPRHSRACSAQYPPRLSKTLVLLCTSLSMRWMLSRGGLAGKSQARERT